MPETTSYTLRGQAGIDDVIRQLAGQPYYPTVPISALRASDEHALIRKLRVLIDDRKPFRMRAERRQIGF